MSAESLLSLLTGGVGAVAVLGIFLGLIVSGKLHTDAEMVRADENFEREAAAYEAEKRAHAETRRALAEASARGDAAVRASELIAGALGGTRSQRSGSGAQKEI